jgi:hypothetical protein
MTHADQLERLIAARSADVLRFQDHANDTACTPSERIRWTQEARRAAADVAALVALRSPQTVARMERERGIA